MVNWWSAMFSLWSTPGISHEHAASVRAYHIANVNRFLFNEGFAPAYDTLYSNSLEGDFGRFGSLVTYW